MNSFTYKEINSLDMGLVIESKKVHGAPERDVTMHQIPGRSGDLLQDNGRYANYQASYVCNILPWWARTQNDLPALCKGIKAWLLTGAGYHKLTDSYNPGYFRMGAYYSKLDIEETIQQVGKATITFDCKPFLYSDAGQVSISKTAAWTLQNPEALPSLPYIRMTASGNVTLQINNQSFVFQGVSSYIEIDSEAKTVRKGTVNQSAIMTTASFPELQPGSNAIAWTGSVSRVQIIPRWCTL